MKGLLTRLRIFINCAEHDIIEQPCAHSPNVLGVIKSTQAAAEFCLELAGSFGATPATAVPRCLPQREGAE